MQEMWVRSLGREDPLEEETETHSCIPAWEIADGGAWRDIIGITTSWTRLSD